ncbi:asparagine synthase (glutamine-hydrolyzing) [Alphaproteobacteria bacterium]|nr:asparagine synthase (glutamine-hydrolyzing) [Alphaproteobacteria bacterium]
MCGISGIINFNKSKINENDIIEMNNQLKHRGPDDDDIYIDKFIGFGHTRLSILDLSANGKQPMQSSNNRYVITYNGEVYNFLDIKKELINRGYIFKSHSDTEVVLNSWLEWGENCINKFNGMFAFAIWDKKEEEFFLVRDRYGIKPVYYHNLNNKFIFASEQRAILSILKSKKELDKETLYEYFTFQNIFSDRTLVKNIKLLNPGTILKISLTKKNKLKFTKYWDFNFTTPSNVKNNLEYQEELSSLLESAVKKQLVSDVEVGTYLSGGIDSSLITFFASKEIKKLKTFSCGFKIPNESGIEFNFDETEKSKSTSKFLKTKYIEKIIESGDMETSLPELTSRIEEPRLGQSYPNYYASQLASSNVKVVLNGVGGDELFGGYPWRYFIANNALNLNEYIDQYYLYWQRLIDNNELKKIFKPIKKDVKDVWTKNIFKTVLNKNHLKIKNKREDFINLAMYFETKTFLHSLLIIEDKISMGFGLETRTPFLDNDLVNFATNIPIDLKIKNLLTKNKIDENLKNKKIENIKYLNNSGKIILRDISKKILPKKITNAYKQGFTGPDEEWFKGESMEFVKSIIKNKNSYIYNFMDYTAVNKIVDLHLEGKKNKRLFIWSLLNTEEYLKNF